MAPNPRPADVAKDWPQHKRPVCTGDWVFWTPRRQWIGCRTCGACEIATPQVVELLRLGQVGP